jgi:hypothetical protein
MRRSALPVFLLVSTFSLIAVAETHTGSFHRTLTVSGSLQLTVTTGSGNIHVTQGPAGVVRVDAVIRSRDQDKITAIEQHPPIEQTGSMIQIGRLPSYLRNHVGISYDITAPAETELQANSGSGDIEVGSLDGVAHLTTGSGNVRTMNMQQELTVSSGSGDVHLLGNGGAVRVNTGSGTIEVARSGAEVRASTGSGDVTVRDPGGAVDAGTGSGNITLDGVDGDVTAHTGSGDIDVTGDIAAHRRWDLRTGSGNVKLHLPQTAAAALDAHADSGEISTTHPLTVTGKLNRHDLHAVMIRADAELSVRTGSGDIRID